MFPDMIKIQLNPLKSSQVFQKSIRLESLHRICWVFSTELDFTPEIEGAPCFPDGSKLYGGEALRDWEPELPVQTGREILSEIQWMFTWVNGTMLQVTLINVGLEFSEHWIHGTETTIVWKYFFFQPHFWFFVTKSSLFFQGFNWRFLGPAKQAIAAIPVAPLVVSLVVVRCRSHLIRLLEFPHGIHGCPPLYNSLYRFSIGPTIFAKPLDPASSPAVDFSVKLVKYQVFFSDHLTSWISSDCLVCWKNLFGADEKFQIKWSIWQFLDLYTICIQLVIATDSGARLSWIFCQRKRFQVGSWNREATRFRKPTLCCTRPSPNPTFGFTWGRPVDI